MALPQYIRISEAARQLGTSRAQVWRLVRSGRLPCKLIGPNVHRVKQDDVDVLRWGAPRGACSSGVYFIQCGDGGPIKIGIAKAVNERLADLQVANPYELRLLGYVPTDDAEALEGRLHGQFYQLRIRGEWFRPEAVLLDFINGLR